MQVSWSFVIHRIGIEFLGCPSQGEKRNKIVKGECLVGIVSYTPTSFVNDGDVNSSALAHPRSSKQVNKTRGFERCFGLQVDIDPVRVNELLQASDSVTPEMVQAAVNLAATFDCFAIQHGLLPQEDLSM